MKAIRVSQYGGPAVLKLEEVPTPEVGPIQVLVRNRRMNWANPRALGRAERRIHAAVKHFTKYIRWVHPTKAGHAAPKFSHRKKR